MPQMQLQIRDEMSASVRQFPRHQPIIFRVAMTADGVPTWGGKDRDAYLRLFWQQESFLASTVYALCARNAGFQWVIEGPEAESLQATQTLRNVEFGQGWQQLMLLFSEDVLCLAGRTRIHLAGERLGKTKKIASIVKDKDPGPVLSLNNDGHLVECRIVEWHKTPLGGRRWWWISLARASGHNRERRGGIFLTEDHPVLTDQGWMEARDVQVGMKVATADPVPSAEQAELLVGGLLGDMCVGMVRKRAILRFSHSVKQEQWLDFKLDKLKGFQWTGRSCRESSGQFGKGEVIRLNSRASLGLVGLRQSWYPKGKKIVDREAVQRFFSPRMLAVWYCDDGTLHRSFTRAGNETTPHGRFYTNGFTKADVEWLAGFLRSKGFPVKAVDQRGSNGTVYPVIYISSEAVRRLAAFIGPYVPPSMRYKLPKSAPAYDPSVWEIEPATVYFDEVVVSEPRDSKSGYRTAQTAYSIGVEETHNFVAANAVVHNCGDNGGFIEIIRPARARINGKSYPAIAKRHKSGDIDWFAIISRMGHVKQVEPEDVSDSPYDLPVSLAHLDAGKCCRTGDPDTPVIYTDRNSREHELKSWQVMSMVDMPSPIEEMHGVGFCFVSRVLRNAQTVRDWTIFRQEKISGRFARAVHLTNVDADWISDAIAQAQAKADERGLLVYSQPIITNTLDPSSRPYLVTIPLAELPDGFTEDETMRWYIGLLALAAGEHYSFLAPMPGRRLGSAREVEVQERQARGKSSRLFMDQLATRINNSGILPEGCVFVFREKDTEEQAAHEQAERRRAETRKLRIESGEITPEIARQIAKDQGDLKDEYLQQLGEEDITPDESESHMAEDIEEKQEELLEDISKDDVARAIGKWNDRMSEAEGVLQAEEVDAK